MQDVQYIGLDEDRDAITTLRDLEELLWKLDDLCRELSEPERIIQINED